MLTAILMWIAIGAANQERWIALTKQASDCQFRGDFECAKKAAEAALKLSEPEGGGWFATSLSNAGSVYHDMGDRSRAERYYRRAIAIQERIGNTLGMVRTMNNLASLYIEHGDTGKAERLNLESLRPAVAHSREELDRLERNLAAIHRARRNFDAAETVLREQLARAPAAPDRVVLLNNLGVMNLDRDRAAHALSYFAEAAALAEATSPGNPAVARCLHNLAMAHLRLGHHAEALAVMERALAMPVIDDLRRAEMLATYAEVLKRSRRKRESAAVEREAKALRHAYVRRNGYTVDFSDMK